MNNDFTIKPIAIFRSPFGSKFGVPKQSGLVDELEGYIEFMPEFRNLIICGSCGIFLQIRIRLQVRLCVRRCLAEMRKSGSLPADRRSVQMPSDYPLCVWTV